MEITTQIIGLIAIRYLGFYSLNWDTLSLQGFLKPE